MAINMVRAHDGRLHRNSTHSHRWVALLGLWYLGGCSIQSFEYLSKGGASSIGGSDQFGGATSENDGGGASNTGGVLGTGGVLNTGGALGTGGALSTGGALNTGGVLSTGGTASTAALPGDGGDLSGCAFTQTGGRLLVPPSQGFESDLGSWSTTNGNVTALTRMPGNGGNCEGDWYVNCNGSRRAANWDGPALEVGSYVSVGHTYQFSVAARQTPSSTVSSAVTLKLVVSITCPTIAYSDIFLTSVLTDWVRLTGQFAVAASASCTVPTSVKLYVASTETGSPLTSFDVDDFKLIDLSLSETSDAGE
jgi:hypothetical protein